MKKHVFILVVMSLLFVFLLSGQVLAASPQPSDTETVVSSTQPVADSPDHSVSAGSQTGEKQSPFGLGTIIVFAIILIYVVSRVLSSRRQKAESAAKAQQPRTPIPANFDRQIQEAIIQDDPAFSTVRFLSWAKEVFITLQMAWTERDWSQIRPFEADELFEKHHAQLQEYIDSHRINMIERLSVHQAYLHKYQKNIRQEFLTVYLEARMSDYIIDENTRDVLQGSTKQEYLMKYFLTFMRQAGVLTDPARSNRSVSLCPHCGKPVKVTPEGKCEHCEAATTTGAYDWVLYALDTVTPQTPIDNSTGILSASESVSEESPNEDSPQAG